jgi:hypothetical protein
VPHFVRAANGPAHVVHRPAPHGQVRPDRRGAAREPARSSRASVGPLAIALICRDGRAPTRRYRAVRAVGAVAQMDPDGVRRLPLMAVCACSVPTMEMADRRRAASSSIRAATWFRTRSTRPRHRRRRADQARLTPVCADAHGADLDVRIEVGGRANVRHDQPHGLTGPAPSPALPHNEQLVAGHGSGLPCPRG